MLMLVHHRDNQTQLRQHHCKKSKYGARKCDWVAHIQRLENNAWEKWSQMSQMNNDKARSANQKWVLRHHVICCSIFHWQLLSTIDIPPSLMHRRTTVWHLVWIEIRLLRKFTRTRPCLTKVIMIIKSSHKKAKANTWAGLGVHLDISGANLFHTLYPYLESTLAS